MELKRDLDKNKIYLVDNKNILLETDHIGGEFVICLSTNTPITITEEVDAHLYANLKQLLDTDYLFDNMGLSFKTGNMIVWFSDGYCDIEDEDQRKRVNRLIIEESNGEIKISLENPFFKEKGIRRKNNYIAFSPCGNGFFSRNISSGLSFQDDFICAFDKTLRCESINVKKRVLEKTIKVD